MSKGNTGSDGGLLQRPVRLEEITIAPSERMDLVIDFSTQPIGTNIVLTNTARTPFDFGAAPDPSTTGLIMQFRVIAATSEDNSTIPQFLSTIKRFNECDACRIRDIALDATMDKYNRFLFLLSNHEFMDGITEDPVVGEVEIWRIINQGIAVHPIHIHKIQFQILDRIPFDTAVFNRTGHIRYTGEPELSPAQERGWKDTIQALPGYVNRVIMRFGPYTGRYVYHCHILEHEDHDMMRPFDVIPRKSTPDPTDCCKE